MIKKDKPSIAFFGTPQFAVHILEQLKETGLEPDVVVTAPDRPAGRGMELREPPVKTWALENEIPVLQPESLTDETGETDLLRNSEWDIFIVAAYGKILKKDVLDIPQKGVLNVHPSLLPKYRGASPIEGQILNDEKEVGVSIMLLDEEMDHGPILAQASIEPEERMRASHLEELLATEGGKLLAEVIPPWLKGDVKAEEQNHNEATFTKKIKKEDGLIELGKNDLENYLKFLAYDEWPGVYFMLEKNGEEIRIKITEAAFENNVFTPLRVIPEGKKEMDYSSL